MKSAQTTRMSMSRRASEFALDLMLAAALLASPASAAPPPGKDADSVVVRPDQMHQLKLVRTEIRDFHMQKPAVGQIAFNDDASTVVLAPFSGRVTRVIAKIGDEVKSGDPLFEIDSPEVVQAQTDLIAAVQGVEKAKSQVALAKKALDRQLGLIADKATSQREVDQAGNDRTIAESDLATAQGALAAARNRLRVIIGRDESEIERVERERVINPRITVNAPIAGTVIARKVGPGQFVRADSGEALYSIADLSVMWLKAYVAENDAPFVRVGQELEVKVLALPNHVLRARVIAVGAASEAATRRVVVRSEIPNPDRLLKAEMFATFRISISSDESSPCVPAEAVIREGDVATVWVQREPQVFQRRSVKIGLEQDGRVQIRDGLNPGEIVVGRGAIFVDNEWRQ
jgi:cobalt-zinc-cadmium efflux system membrane fusion protein